MSEETQSDGAMHKAFPCCPDAERMWEDKALLGPAKPLLIFILCLTSSRPTLNTFEVLARLPLAGVLGGWPALQVKTPKHGKSSCWLSSPRTMGEVRDRVRATASVGSMHSFAIGFPSHVTSWGSGKVTKRQPPEVFAKL